MDLIRSDAEAPSHDSRLAALREAGVAAVAAALADLLRDAHFEADEAVRVAA